MAKARTDLVIEEAEETRDLLVVWSPMLIPVIEIIEAIEGVSHVFHSTTRNRLNVWVSPCYDKGELIAEIRAAVERLTPCEGK